MEELYKLVKWPESQDFASEHYNDCFLVNDESVGPAAYMVPIELYYKIKAETEINLAKEGVSSNTLAKELAWQVYQGTIGTEREVTQERTRSKFEALYKKLTNS